MEDLQKEQFFCPMKCEESKVYDQPGDCPICNMHLIPVNQNNKPGKHVQ